MAAATTNVVATGNVALTSPLGAVFLERASELNTKVKDEFDGKSKSPSSLASLVILINALNVAYRIKYTNANEKGDTSKYYQLIKKKGHKFVVDEKDITSNKNVAKYLKKSSINLEGLKDKEMQLKQLEVIAMYLGFGSDAHYACNGNACQGDETKQKLKSALGENYDSDDYLMNGVREFRVFARDHVNRFLTGIIVHYFKGSTENGEAVRHFSPLAGYDKSTDRFLVMEIGSAGVWMKTKDLFNKMGLIDPDSRMPGGLIHMYELI